MVSPTNFFSTLAQISATVVGFIIAISTVIYSIERQKREDRTDELRKSLNDFFVNNEKLLSEILHAYEDAAPDKYTEEFEKIEGDFGQAVSKAKQLSEKSDSNVVVIYCHLAILLYSTLRLETRCESPELKEIVHDFKTSLDKLQYDFFISENEFNRELYKEITEKDNDDIPEEYLLEQDVFERDRTESIIKHLNENKTSALVNPHQSSELFVVLSGNELHTIRAMVNRLRLAFPSVNAEAHRTLLDYDPNIVQIIKLSLLMLLTGVIIPLSFLFTFPSVLTFQAGDWFIFTSQIAILSSTIFVFLSTVELLLIQVQPSTVGSRSHLSKFFLFVLNRVS